MEEGLKKQTKQGIIWSAVQRFSLQGTQFVITLFMARLLSPREYGIVGMLGIFLAISGVFIDCGFTSAITRKQDRTHEDLCTVFWFNIVIACIAYIILFIGAPYISAFYNMPELTLLTRVLGLTVIIGAFNSVQYTLLVTKLDFKSITKVTLPTTILSGIVGILCAYFGFSYWALVISAILSTTLGVICYWHFSDWRPTLTFSKSSFKEMFSFGSKLLLTSLIDTTYNNLYGLVIGKKFSASALGNFSRAESYANFPSMSVSGVMQRVTYPVLCKIQNNDTELKNSYRKFPKLTAFIIFPMMFGLSALSKPFVILVIGEQWSFCAELLLILCFSQMWYPIHAINLGILQVKGRTDLSLKLEIIQKLLGVLIMIIAIPWGIIALCYSCVIDSFLCLFINAHYSGKLINLSIFRQLVDFSPTIISSAIMFILIKIVIMSFDSLLLQLIIGSVTGGLVYFITSFVLNKEILRVCFKLIKL